MTNDELCIKNDESCAQAHKVAETVAEQRAREAAEAQAADRERRRQRRDSGGFITSPKPEAGELFVALEQVRRRIFAHFESKIHHFILNFVFKTMDFASKMMNK